ncbi:MAG: DAK2 domain-containing protein [Chloroflexi bacterium]|nr:DAK2 domain-containing protein [Chloroflexota bacterium]
MHPSTTNPEEIHCDGRVLKRWFSAATAWLENRAQEINTLNVYPVPDGDTGTNMLLTMKAAITEAEGVNGAEAGKIAHALSHGALMGARGNSGVILSQILRGISKAIDGKGAIDARGFADALKEGSLTAYKGMMKPVEGTILTVCREAAEAAVAAATRRNEFTYMMEETVAAARDSVARTPTLLETLRKAGVVDAGGQGYFTILEGILRFLHGDTGLETHVVAQDTPSHHAGAPRKTADMQYGYCTEFIIEGENLDVERIRKYMSSQGDSVIVVGDEDLVKVHVHTFRPGRVLDFGGDLGILLKIKIDNMQTQHEHYLSLNYEAGEAAAQLTATARPQESPLSAGEAPPIGIIAVVSGEGLTQVFKSLGATAVVSGGQTNNPSTQDLLSAIEASPSPAVILLPNNKNIILAANQARELTQKKVVVVPSRTAPQGISALLANNYQASLEQNASAMEQALHNVTTVEVTRAVRDVEINALAIKVGDVIAMVDGELANTGQDLVTVTTDALQRINASKREIITLYYGSDLPEEKAQQLAAKIRSQVPGPEVEVVSGGQPYYPVILSVE